MSRRLASMLAVLAMAGLILVSNGDRPGQALGQVPLYDFVEYWAAGQLLVAGENPYDAQRIAQLQKEAGSPGEPILMWNPPWVLPVVLPLGALPVRTAHLVWLALHFVVLLVSAELLWRHYGGDPDYSILGPTLTLGFVPCLVALVVGQIAPLMLLGAAAFLTLVQARRDAAAGAVACLLAVKPHMAYLFWVALLVWAVSTRRWRLLAAGALTGLALTVLALAFRPTLLADYWATARQTPAQYVSPTLGYLLRVVLDDPWFGWQFLPLLPGLAWLAWYGWRHRAAWDWSTQMPWLLLVSTLTAAYGAWLFDLVLLVVPILHVATRLGPPTPRAAMIAGGAVFVALGVGITGLLLAPWHVEYLYYIWITPVVLIAYLAFDTYLTRRYTNQPQPAGPPAG
ncbi:MAG: glycosyltransferase family 87 protein [Gemmataceae bacterium]